MQCGATPYPRERGIVVRSKMDRVHFLVLRDDGDDVIGGSLIGLR
jgi:hypothetical protein